jgi:polygalacturonase
MKKLIFSFIITIMTVSSSLRAQDATVYKASLFGCVSDGVTLNTNSIQTAVNAIHEKGGGELHFYVGRYLTGSIHLKSNVTIVLHEGATLVGTSSIYDYDSPAAEDAPRGLIVAEGQSNIGVIGALAETPSVPTMKTPEIKGMGIIQGRGDKVRTVMESQQQKGFLENGNNRIAPALISFVGCDGVKVEGLMMLDAAGDVQTYKNCKNVSIANLLINSRKNPDSDGIEYSGCNGLLINNSFFDVSGLPVRSSNNSTGVKTKNNKTKTGTLPMRVEN